MSGRLRLEGLAWRDRCGACADLPGPQLDCSKWEEPKPRRATKQNLVCATSAVVCAHAAPEAEPHREALFLKGSAAQQLRWQMEQLTRTPVVVHLFVQENEQGRTEEMVKVFVRFGRGAT